MCLVPINTSKKSNSLFSFVRYVEKNGKRLLRIFDELKWEDCHLCTWLSGQNEKVGNEPLKITLRAQRVHSAWSRSIRFTELQFNALFSHFYVSQNKPIREITYVFNKKNINSTQGYELNKGNSWAAKKTTHTQSVLLTGDLQKIWLLCKYDFFMNNVYFFVFFLLTSLLRFPAEKIVE